MEGNKFGKVMHEWKEGDLNSGGSGKPVAGQKQALAIAFSEQRRSDRGNDMRKRAMERQLNRMA